ncbi:MAG: hypothetical protein MJ014_05605 [Methanocorpusculum sp.]|nr:hypothetical protein [Methanocorpusculum sp.]
MNRIHIILFVVLVCGSLAAAGSAASADRPGATSTITYVDDSGFSAFAQAMLPNHGAPMDWEGMIAAAVKPITDQIGAFFYVILFGVPYLVIWFRQGSLIVPSILGIILGAWMIIRIPAAYTIPAVALLALIVAGGLYGIYATRN